MKVMYDGSYFTVSGGPSPTPRSGPSRLEGSISLVGRYKERDYKATIEMINEINEILQLSGLVAEIKWHLESKSKSKSRLVPVIRLTEGAIEEIKIRTKTKCWNLGSDKCVSFPYGIHAGKMITAIYQLSAKARAKEGGYIVIAMEKPYPLLLYFDLNPNLPRGDWDLIGTIRSIYAGGLAKGWQDDGKLARNKGIWCIAHNLQYGYYHVWNSQIDFINWMGNMPLEGKV
tara:strand:- start:6024 stop:6713 length:690 start_codon:yes stop_codon:yes gene_type:complete